ncbi:hypothetical protein FLT15_18865 [Paenibacillus thiaminolyticus]|uniref:hypothetical protein n=1 Tax=Paenibacillus thiaminolyticus TaxID=49283 RepID=UPI001164BB42|nr:hypothetical protein [Paenibacillus thiaminolyticus]NGP60313.1 hypothetical protein [Paenibacillus thiaminolyticus]
MRSNALRPRPKHTCPRHIGSGRSAALWDLHAGVPADTSVAVLAIGGFLRTSAAGLTIGGLRGRALPWQAFPAGGTAKPGHGRSGRKPCRTAPDGHYKRQTKGIMPAGRAS